MNPDRGFAWDRIVSLGRGVPAARSALHALRRPTAIAMAALLGLTTAPMVAATSAYDPAADGYSMQAITHGLGADAWWNAGYTGAGVDVALIDSGVVPVAGLDGSDKIVYGPDLSFESQSPDPTLSRHVRARHLHGRPDRRT